MRQGESRSEGVELGVGPSVRVGQHRLHRVPRVLYSVFVALLKQTAFRLAPDLLGALQTIKVRDGIPVSEQVRRALLAWVEAKGVLKPERKRAATRKRP